MVEVTADNLSEHPQAICFINPKHEFYHKKVDWLKEQFEIVGDVRGLAPMLALELVKARQTKEPADEAAKALVQACLEKGLIILACGTYGNVIRILMPLNIGETELDKGLAIMEEGFTEISNK